MEKKEITRKLKEILSKHEGNTSEGAIYWDSEWVGGKQIPTGGGGYRQEGGKLVCKDKEFYTEMADFISQELSKAKEEGKKEYLKEVELMQRFSSRKEIDLTRDEAFKRLVRLLKSKLKDI